MRDHVTSSATTEATITMDGVIAIPGEAGVAAQVVLYCLFLYSLKKYVLNWNLQKNCLSLTTHFILY